MTAEMENGVSNLLGNADSEVSRLSVNLSSYLIGCKKHAILPTFSLYNFHKSPYTLLSYLYTICCGSMNFLSAYRRSLVKIG